MPDTIQQDIWLDAKNAERYANSENATRPFADLIISKSKLADATGDLNIFDLATGTGAAVRGIYAAVPRERWNKVSVLGGDVSDSMLAYLRARGKKEGWEGLRTEIIDGNNLNLPPNTFTHILSTFALFLIPNCLPTLHSLLKPGGFVGVTTWASLAWYPLLQRCISRMSSPPYNPSAGEIDDKLYAGRAWGSQEYLASQLREGGFVEVETQVEKVVAKVGTPASFMETMQIPLVALVKPFWPADKQDALLAELNEVMLKEVVSMAGGEDKHVEMESEAVLGWGVKA